MSWKSVCLAVLCGSLTAPIGKGSDGDDLYLVDVHDRREIEADATRNLAPSLLATKDAGGVLKGSDLSAKPVIAVSAEKVEDIRKSRAVRSISPNVPKDWQPVRRLKLSYKADDKLNEDDLKKLGLKVIEDYQRGSFMVVEPVNGQIDALLAARLECCPKIRYITPLFQAKAIEPFDR
jgi:hypothetical protein